MGAAHQFVAATGVKLLPERELAIDIRGLSKTFSLPAGGNWTALQGIDLQVERGKFLSLVGPSGCGKSTMLRLISGLLSPTSGTVNVFGQSPEQFRSKNRMGFVFQDATLLPWRTVLGNVLFPMEILGVYTRKERLERAEAYLELVRLHEFRKSYPAQLSGGMRQRVSIARALADSPAILLMDEPFGALDEITRQDMQEELLRIWAETGITTIFVTHSLSEALFLSDEVAVMQARPGRITGSVVADLPRPREPSLRLKPNFVEQLMRLEAMLRDPDQQKS
ncbi:ABC transporter ATP-binding protein [Microvirga sp. BT350]|uniref:ABC transporter ATP-binding protein n=2 Tax=Microvirga alba TaxID=2791025 RepID=A0A931BPM6_9HYPH|nr:ABC transporter ATP-binding protein [Microvirga alba]